MSTIIGLGLKPMTIGGLNTGTNLSLSSTAGNNSTATGTGTTKAGFWDADGGLSKVTNSLSSIIGLGTTTWAAVENINLQKQIANAQIKQGQAATPISSQNQVISNDSNAGLIAQNAAYQAKLAEDSNKAAQKYMLIGLVVVIVGLGGFFLMKAKNKSAFTAGASAASSANIPMP